MDLCLEREGEFVPTGMIETSDRCGQIGLMKYQYAVRIEGTDESLSPEGFIIENSRVHNYFLSRYCGGKRFVAMSCEKMASKAAMDIGKTLIKEHISVKLVQVTITGSNNARLTAVWTSDKR